MSLSLLNAWGQTSVEYTELRQPKIRFDRTTATNQTAQTVASGSHLVPVGIEVIELVIPEQVLLYMEILFALAANKSVVLTQQQLVDSSLESLGNGLYRITPINSLEAWQRVRQPTIQITGAQGYTAFTYTVTLHYSGNLTKSYTVSAQVVIECVLSAQFALSAEAELLPAVTVSAIGVTLVAAVSAQKVLDASAALTSTISMPSTEAQNVKGTTILLTSQFSQTGEAISSGLSWQQASTALTPIPVEISFSQLGAITVYYSQNNIVEVNTISVPLGVITELPASSFTGVKTISIVEDTAQLSTFKITQQTGSIYSWSALTEVTGNTADLTTSVGKNILLQNVPETLAGNLTRVCLANLLQLDWSRMANWDTSNLTNMNSMFKGTLDLGGGTSSRRVRSIEMWKTSRVTDMTDMFKYCPVIDSDLSGWCVEQIPTAPTNFDFQTTNWTRPNTRPVWGTCPTVSKMWSDFYLDNVPASYAAKGGDSLAISRLYFYDQYINTLGRIPANKISVGSGDLQSSIIIADAFALKVPSAVITNINSVTVDTNTTIVNSTALFNGTNALRTTPIQIPSQFTIEFWIRFTSLSGDRNLFDARDQTGDQDSPAIFRRSNNNLVYWTGRRGDLVSAASPISINNWYHIAVTRDSNNLVKMFVNGTQHGSSVSHNDTYSLTPISIGAYAGQNNVLAGITGNIDEFRLSNIARYTSNFTATPQQFGSDANTLLLLHMDGANGSTVFRDDITDRPGV